MSNHQNSSQENLYYIEGPLLDQLIRKKRDHQKLGGFYKRVLKSLHGMDDATAECQDALWRLQQRTIAFKKRLDKEKLDNVELHSAYYLKAITFLQDFESEATQTLFTDTRKQIKTFIYSALYESMVSCENSQSFKLLFKQSEGLEFDLWVTERLTQLFLRIQEYLSHGHGISLDDDHLPATEIDLFESIKTQIADKLMNIDMDVLTIPINDDEEDLILNWSINGCNYRIRQGYFKHAFKLSIFLNSQLEDIAHGMGLARLGNLFAMETAMLKLAYKDAATKDKMEIQVSNLSKNVGDKKEDIEYWSIMTHQVQEAIYQMDGSSNAQLENVESDWLKKLLDHPQDSLPPIIVNAFCGLLKYHKKLKLRQAKRFELEGQYIAFTNPNFDYKSITEEELEEEIAYLKASNNELREDLVVMNSSPDALFQLITQKSGSKHNVVIHEDHQKELEQNLEDSEDPYSFLAQDPFWGKLDGSVIDYILSDEDEDLDGELGEEFDEENTDNINDDFDTDGDGDDDDDDDTDNDLDTDELDAPEGDPLKK